MILHKAETRFAIQKLRTYMPFLFKAEAREAADLVFSVMLIFMLTCIGSMLLICFFFEMDRLSSPQPVETQQLAPSSSNVPAR